MTNKQQQLGLLMDSLQSNGRLKKAWRDVVVAIGECATSIPKYFCEFVASLASSNIAKCVEALADEQAAYTLAAKEHREWVHRATYCKKKRIRKKYHDRIMRKYWRG